MKKIVILVGILSVISFAGNRGEISFQKQVEKVEKERIERLNQNQPRQEENNVKNNSEITQNSNEMSLFADDKIEKISKKKSDVNSITENKLVNYIKTQNNKITDIEIKRILRAVFGYSKQYNINPYLVLAVMNTESNFNHNTVSSAGARGLMQLMPFNFREFGVSNSVEENIKGGILHLKRDYEKHKNIVSTLVCYNAGCGRLPEAWKGIKETREYIPKVFNYYKKLTNL